VEIWEQTSGNVDGFTCAVGSGGTLAGVSMALQERNSDIKCFLTDPLGSKLYSWIKHGALKTHGSSITEGIGQGCLGGSAGINIAGAVRLAREMGPGHTIVTILCDYGNRYASKLFNPEFLQSKNLPVPHWLE